MRNHQIRGATTVTLASLALGALMFLPRFFSAGIAVGVFLLLLITVGIWDYFGTIEIVRFVRPTQDHEPVEMNNAPRWLSLLSLFDRRLLYVAVGLFVAGLCRLSVIGTPAAEAPWSGPALLGLGVAFAVTAYLRRQPFDGNLHEGTLVLCVSIGSIFATLGSQGLWDCWETHYGEVARRQLEQDDWISLYWQDKWFFSKPVLIFWMMNLGMALVGSRVGPDQISGHIEWGVRFFVGVLAVAILYAVYKLVAERVSKRAGLFVSLVLGTMPLFNFMTRQAITDLPFVGFMTLAVVFFLYGITAPQDAEVKSSKFPIGFGRHISISGFHTLVAGLVIAGVPQFLYIATRGTKFLSGTLGRGNLKTIESELQLTGINLSNITSSFMGVPTGGTSDISLDWLLLGVAYGTAFALTLRSLRHERRVSKLCYVAVYVCLAMSVLAKGLPGLVLPLIGLFGFWLIIAPWKKLPHFKSFVSWHWQKARQLDVFRGTGILVLFATPWYLAMTVRHGIVFLNRFFYHDHIKRLSMGVHGETGTLYYFAEQFAYAAFPWVALLPLAILAWPAFHRLMSPNGSLSGEQRSARIIRLFATTWLLGTFALMTMMVTKFHHYVLPMLPPAALLIGLLLDDVWRGRLSRIGSLALVAVTIVIATGRELVTIPEGSKGVLEGFPQLIGLFIYKYKRPYPTGEAYDFGTELLVFTILFACCFALWSLSKRRHVAIVITSLLALVFSHWISEHYMVKLAPHWTQKHMITEYYEQRESAAERLVAFQMNWKGENFYTGNRILVYVSTKNKDFEDWIEDHRGERHFFMTEHNRFKRMSKRTAAKSGSLQPLSDTCNKYRIGVADEL